MQDSHYHTVQLADWASSAGLSMIDLIWPVLVSWFTAAQVE
jgi:hypothetical protein